MIRWTEGDLLMLIKAVMNVEEELRNESNSKPIEPSSGNPMGKWKRVTNLLPPAFQERILQGSEFRCMQLFNGLTRSIKEGKRKFHRGRMRYALTKSVHELLKKRQSLLNTGTSIRAEEFPASKRPDARRAKNYTEGERILVIKAVMHVEEQMRNKTNKEGGPSSSKPKTKWQWVASLLPPGLRECYRDNGNWNDPKCRSVFNNVLHAFEAESRGTHYGSNRRCLTEPIRDLLKNRRDLMNSLTSTTAENSAKSGSSSNRVRKAENISRQSNDLHRTEVPSPFDNNAEEIQRSMERNDSIFSFRSASRSSRVPHGYDKKNRPARSTVRSASRSGSESRDAANVEKPSAQPGVQTRRQIRLQKMDRHSSVGPPYNPSPGSHPMRKRKRSMPHTTYDGHKHTALDGSLRRIDQEFCCLSSWLQSQSIPVAKTVLNERVTSASGSTKRRKLNIHKWIEPLDGSIYESLRSKMDLQIRASFQKLKFRFAQELRNTAVELAQEVLRVTQ